MQYTRLTCSPDSSASQITQLLKRLREKDRSALEELMPLVYDELRGIARCRLSRQRSDHTLQPTALVNEAFIKLFEQSPPKCTDRAHFFAVMSCAMRQVLVDHSRAVAANKRGGQLRKVPLEADAGECSRHVPEPPDLLELDEALNALERADTELAQVIELHYFGGMTAEETAAATGRSPHVVRHDLRLARAWLRRRIAG